MTIINASPNAMNNTKVTVGTGTTVVLAYNANRVFAEIFNDSDAVIYLGLGEAAVMNEGVRIAIGGSYKFDVNNLWIGAINAISAAGSKVVCVIEGTRTH